MRDIILDKLREMMKPVKVKKTKPFTPSKKDIEDHGNEIQRREDAREPDDRDAEINQMAAFFDMTLEHYLEYVGQSKLLGQDFTQQQNRYCEYQRKNPHTPRVMKMMGLTEEEANWYFNEVMFPCITAD